MNNDPRPLHRSALEVATQQIDRITNDDLDRSTPCGPWTLGELLAHMIGQHLGFAAAVTNVDASASEYEPVPFSRREWDASVSTLLEAFAGADMSAASVLVEIGASPLPNRWVVAAQLLDTAVHSWDIGQALGSWHEPAADIIAAVADLARTIPDDERRGAPHGAFGAAVQAEGSTWELTLAHLGRSPHDAPHH